METAFKIPAPPVPPLKKRPRPVIVCCLIAPLLLMAAGGIFVAGIRRYGPKTFIVMTEAMEPALMGHDADRNGHKDTVHDTVMANPYAYKKKLPEQGDIIVFRAPKSADAENEARGLPQVEIVHIKRVIGIPGDTIEVKGGFVYRNNEKLNEPFIKEPMDDPQRVRAIYATQKPLKLEPDELFVMGDNRNDSNDSRYWVPLKSDRIIGKATMIIAPPERQRSLK